MMRRACFIISRRPMDVCVCVLVFVDLEIGKNVEPRSLFEFRTLLGGGWPEGP